MKKPFNLLCLSLFVTILTLFNSSCKKEIYDAERLDPSLKAKILAYKNGPKVEVISLSQFKNKANLTALGALKDEFLLRPSHQQKIMAINTPETFNGFQILTDSIKVIKDKGHVMYVFPVKLPSKRSISFQNLTIDEGPAGTIAFINTYTPTKKWIEEWKKGMPGKFEGNIGVTYLSLQNTSPLKLADGGNSSSTGKISAVNNAISLTRSCSTITYYYAIPYKCASGQHYPGDSGCHLIGDDAAGYVYITSEVTTCEDLPEPLPPSEGGGTTPTPPGNYDPCDSGTSPVAIQAQNGATGAKLMVAATTPCDEEPLPLISEEDPLQAYNKLCASSFIFSTVVAPGDGSRGWKEAAIKDLTINVVASNYFEHIWNTIIGGAMANFNLTIGVPGDLPSVNASKEAGIAVNKAMVDIYRSYGSEGVKNLINTGQIGTKIAVLAQIQLGAVIPGARVSSILSNRVAATSPIIGVNCQ